MENGNEASRINRCLIERQRRQHMKSLVSKLFALLPPRPNKMSVPELVDQAIAYVKQLQKKLEQYKQIKVQLEDKLASATACTTRNRMIVPPVLNIRDLGSNLEVHLITGLNSEFALSDFISILQEEGAEIISATCHHAGDRAIYRILSQAIYPRIGIATSSVHERLKSLTCLKKQHIPTAN
ncbi:transcription factor bHLH168-like [Durio zibethinus]|uniref:Transcription factor bHLH168-like n=1 Tax=Durio zibethinus TaxID=66656 RepID=A0A6P5Y4H0_DURZI|nr:transcription factor bHLH168-like [Durio zibethinus]